MVRNISFHSTDDTDDHGYHEKIRGTSTLPRGAQRLVFQGELMWYLIRHLI